MNRYSQWFIILITLLFEHETAIAAPPGKGRIAITIEPVYNGQPLRLASQPYVHNGDTLYIDLFRFYMTNVSLHSTASLVTDSNSHMVDAAESSSLTFYLNNIVPGAYTTLHFTLGVDSIANTNGANGGDLDPAKGMYWAWNTGYIMAKLEGHSHVCKTLHHVFEYHIGGYLTPYNAARNITLQLPAAFTVADDKETTIHIKADVAAWLKNVDLAKTNDIVMPGIEAMMIADNYAAMFALSPDNNE